LEGRGHPVKRETISRRRALQQVALLLGGATSAPTVAGVFSTATRRAWAASPAWAPRTLSAAQLELVATLAEHIVPQTETPGARAAGVHRFVDTLLTDHYPAAERDRFLTGLAGLGMITYDAIVIGSGITGGWAAKELTEKGLATLVIERGRNVEHRKDYITEHKPSWELPLRNARLAVGTRGAEEYPIQARTGQFHESVKHFFIKDHRNPYIEDKPFTWIQGDQVGGKSLIWGRQV